MYDGCTAGHGTYAMQAGMGPNGDLEGFLDVVTAPFRAAASGVKFVARRVPTAAAGFVAGGPAGAVAAVAGREIARLRGGRQPQQQPQQPPLQTPGIFPNQGMYTAPSMTTSTSTAGAPNLEQMGRDFLNLLKNRGLETAGRMIADTPQGQAAIREKVTGDISRYMLPAALIGIPLMFVLLRR